MTTIILRRLIDRIMKHYGKDLPPPAYELGETVEYMVPMRDGVRLKTDVFFPSVKGDFPIIFVRSPYVSDFDYYKYIFKNFVKYGFILCFQDCRGRGKSEGEFVPFEFERNDGIDAVKWLKSTPWYSGKIAPVGVSYLAMNQLLYCDTWDDDFKTAVLSMYGGNLYNLAYENGMFREEFFTVWAAGNNPVKNIEGDEGLDFFKKTASYRPRSNLFKHFLGEELGFYKKLISNPSRRDSVWDNEYMMPDASNIKCPLMLISGWYDFTVREVMKIYGSLKEDVKSESALLIGPWTHLMQNNGEKKAPGHYIAGFMGFKYALGWMMNFFYGSPVDINKGVRYYVLNKNAYVSGSSLPEFTEEKLFLGPVAAHTGSLGPFQAAEGKITYIFDPDEPVPTHGGGSASPALLSAHRRPVQCCALLTDEVRDDVLVFTSPSILQEKTVLGGYVELKISSSAPDTCFAVRLCAVEDKKTYAFSYGISNIVNNCGESAPYTPGQERTLRIDLSPVAYKLKKKSSLMLTVSSSDYPSFHLHPNVSGPWADAGVPQKVKNTVHLNGSSLTVFYTHSS